MGRISLSTERRQTAKRARRLPRLRLPPGPFLAALVVAAALAPDPWLRSVVVAVVIVAAYAAGWREGRRDLALDLLGGRNAGAARRPAPPAGGAKGGGEG